MGGAKWTPTKARKKVEGETLVRAIDGSAFTKCEGCNKDVPVVLIGMHNCSLDSKIEKSLKSQLEKVVEAKTPEKKRSSTPSEEKESSGKKAKKSKDSSKRKRPPTAFFVFMDGIRKEGGKTWKSMTEEEKKPYIEKAAQLKAEYEKAVEEENKAEYEKAVEDANEEQNGEDAEDEKVASDKEDEAVSDKEEAVPDKEQENED